MIRLPMVDDPSLPPRGPDGLVPCVGCGQCCTYSAVPLDNPRTPQGMSEMLWHSYHGAVICRDSDGGWMLIIGNQCRHLQPNRTCGIYETRPALCRTYDRRDCEVNGEATHERIEFRRPEELADFFRRERPRTWARAVAKKLTGVFTS